MNKKDLDILLNKFYCGETSLDEEQQLRPALEGDDADALLMQALDQVEEEVEVPANLEMSLSGMIDEWEAQEKREANENRKAKVVTLFWKRTAWAAAASVAVIAAVGWWLLRNGLPQVAEDNSPSIIAKVEKSAQETSAQTVEVESDVVVSEHEVVVPDVPSQPQLNPKPLRHAKPASSFKNNVEHLAQANKGTQSEAQLSDSDEEIVLAALEKFSAVLNKGMDQLDNANEKINDINNTIQQHLI